MATPLKACIHDCLLHLGFRLRVLLVDRATNSPLVFQQEKVKKNKTTSDWLLRAASS